jgi:hypothetical protein
MIVGQPLAAPARSAGGRVPRSQVHQLTEDLRRSIQDLYQRAVDSTGHP